MTALQVFAATPRDRSPPVARPSSPWRKALHRWLGQDPGSPLVLRHVAPPPETADATAPPGLGEMAQSIAASASLYARGLMNAYVASAVEIALEADALDDGAPLRFVRTPVHALVAEVAETLRPCAATAGAKLLHDRDCAWMCAAVTDPCRLRKALSHLVVRALATPGDGGAVRLGVTVEPTGVRISVLSTRKGRDPGLFDLTALMRLLRAMDGALVCEPSQAGCVALSILLPKDRDAGPSFGARVAAPAPEGRS